MFSFIISVFVLGLNGPKLSLFPQFPFGLSCLSSFVSVFCQSFVVSLPAFVIDTALFDIDQQKLKTHKETDVLKDSQSSQTRTTINFSSKVFMKAQILMCVFMPLQHVFLHYSNNYMFKLQHK